MEIQTFSGSAQHPRNLVLYLNLTFHTRPWRVDSFTSTVLETTEKDPTFPAPDSCPVFFSSGGGFKEWQAAHACIDVLLGYRPETGTKRILEEWILSLSPSQKARDLEGAERIKTYRVYIQVRNEGLRQNLGQHSTGLIRFLHYFASPMVSDSPIQGIKP